MNELIELERKQRHLLMMRVKRLEQIVKALVSIATFGLCGVGAYWAMPIYREHGLWGLLGVLLTVAIFLIVLYNAQKDKLIRQKEAELESTGYD